MKETYSESTIKLMQLHCSRLLEKDRRQYAALEALKLGRGGTTYISNILAVDRKTLCQGKKELIQGLTESLPPGRQRKAGGGRKKKQKTTLR